jgi:N-acetylmuramic acid 6-phosphate etherase
LIKKLSNNKLIDRGAKMIMDELKVSETKAKQLLKTHGNVRNAITNFTK